MLFQQQTIVNLQAKHTSKSHTASPEYSLYLILSNTLFGYICCLHAILTRFKTNIYSKFLRFLATTAQKWVI